MNLEKIYKSLQTGGIFKMVTVDKNSKISMVAVLKDARNMSIEYVKLSDLIIAENYSVQDLVNDVIALKGIDIEAKLETLNNNIQILKQGLEVQNASLNVIKQEVL